MARPWIVSLLVGAAAVAAILYATGGSEPTGTGRTPDLRAPPPLTEKEIQLYLEIWPELDARMADLARKITEARLRGETYEDTGEVALWLDAFLKGRKMSAADWQAVRTRVEFVVGVMRFERDKGVRDDRIEKEIARTKVLVENSRGETRVRHEADLKLLQDRLRMKARPISDESRRLATKYWKQLDRVVKETK